MAEDLLDFISRDVKAYMDERGMAFSDFTAAGLIYNSPLPVSETDRRLDILAGRTADGRLRSQIRDQLAVRREDLEAFSRCTDGYVFETYDEAECLGRFASAELALGFGTTLGKAFRVEKHELIREAGIRPPAGKVYLNPWLSSPVEFSGCITKLPDDFAGSAAVEFFYDETGTLLRYISHEVSRSDERTLTLMFDPRRFEHAFSPLPDPFERGDAVRDILTGERGVVATSRADYEALLKRAGNGHSCDFWDASIVVLDRLEDVMQRSHRHVLPVFLERI